MERAAKYKQIDPINIKLQIIRKSKILLIGLI